MKTPRLFYFFIIIFFFSSCSNPYNKKISDTDARKYLEQICKKSDSTLSNQLKEDFRTINLVRVVFPDKANAAFIHIYGYKYDDLTFNDLINQIEDKSFTTIMSEINF